MAEAVGRRAPGVWRLWSRDHVPGELIALLCHVYVDAPLPSEGQSSLRSSLPPFPRQSPPVRPPCQVTPDIVCFGRYAPAPQGAYSPGAKTPSQAKEALEVGRHRVAQFSHDVHPGNMHGSTLTAGQRGAAGTLAQLAIQCLPSSHLCLDRSCAVATAPCASWPC